MEDLTALQTFIFLGIAGISIAVFANALLDVYVRPPTTRFFFPRGKTNADQLRPGMDE